MRKDIRQWMQRISAGKCMTIKEAQDASCASLIAFIRAMLVVDDGTRITRFSLHGEGGMKDKWERSSQVRRLREHPIHRCEVPLPRWGRQRGGSFAATKGSQPRLAALGGPFHGKGLAWTLPPSYGRRCSEGAEIGWGKRYEKERRRSSQVRRLREHPIHCCAVPLSQWGRQRNENAAFLALSVQIHAYVEKQYRRTKPSPRGEGGEQSEPDRVLAG